MTRLGECMEDWMGKTGWRGLSAEEAVESFVMCYEKQMERLEIPCAHGTLVAGRSGDAGVYDEVAIDLKNDEGRVMQLAVIGTSTYRTDGDGKPELHSYVWDGGSENYATAIYPDTESAVWY